MFNIIIKFKTTIGLNNLINYAIFLQEKKKNMGIWFWFVLSFISFAFITLVRKRHDYAMLYTIAICFAINANIFNASTVPIFAGEIVFSIDSILKKCKNINIFHHCCNFNKCNHWTSCKNFFNWFSASLFNKLFKLFLFCGWNFCWCLVNAFCIC